MALFLRDSDVARVLEMDRVIAAVEEAFLLLGQGRALNRPRRRVQNPDGSVLHVMSAALPPWGVMGLKAYTSAPAGTRFIGLLYSTDTGELLALMEATRLGQMRTGAASAGPPRHMARPDAGSLGVIGTGWQARGQVAAISRVRPVALVKCYSRTPERREQFAAEMVQELGAEVVPVDSAAEAVEGVDIVVTATTAPTPVLRGEWLRPGMHINAIGSNWAHKQELDVAAVGGCHRIAVDDLEQARQESGDLIAAVEAGAVGWEAVVELARIVAGQAPGRASPDEVTLFESQGIAIEDVAAMKVAYDRALDLGVGEVLSRPPASIGDP